MFYSSEFDFFWFIGFKDSKHSFTQPTMVAAGKPMSQRAITCPKLMIETSDQGAEYVQS